MFLSYVLPLVVVVASAMPPSGAPGRTEMPDRDREYRAVSRFLKAVDEYVVSRRLIDPLEPDALCLPDDALSTLGAFRALPSDERPTLREGDLFSAEIAELVRHRLAARARRYEFAPPDFLATVNREELSAPHIAVGAPLPWDVGTRRFAWLFTTLPVLPEGLEYRLVARHLVLLDTVDNVVVDILRDALPMY